MPPSRQEQGVAVESARFTLVRAANGEFLLHRDDETPLAVPSEWLVPPDVSEEGTIVSPNRFSARVSSFAIGNGITGLHLSSYEIQSEGSAQAAAGRDVFLILHEDERRLSDGRMQLGISKSRGRSVGCWHALMHRFLVADVDGDDRIDLGVVREEVNCVGTDVLTSQPRGYPVKWHVFSGLDWEYRPEFDDAMPAAVRVLPLLDLVKSPVDFVREIDDRR